MSPFMLEKEFKHGAIQQCLRIKGFGRLEIQQSVYL
jgi:hypothetical protein